MKLPPDLKHGLFLDRVNRFVARVEVDGEVELAHVANSGRLEELFEPGREVLLADRAAAHRRTRHDLLLVRLPGTWASADARLPLALVEEAFAEGRLPEFAAFDTVRREVRRGHSRIDLEFSGPAGTCLVEVKSVTLVRDGVGLFPDAPTERGRRHLRTLMAERAAGSRAAVVFVIQREDATAWAPNDAIDPEFGRLVQEAATAGVEVYAYRCRVSEQEIALGERLTVGLAPRA